MWEKPKYEILKIFYSEYTYVIQESILHLKYLYVLYLKYSSYMEQEYK